MDSTFEVWLIRRLLLLFRHCSRLPPKRTCGVGRGGDKTRTPQCSAMIRSRGVLQDTADQVGEIHLLYLSTFR
jgi:hypothetical protein